LDRDQRLAVGQAIRVAVDQPAHTGLPTSPAYQTRGWPGGPGLTDRFTPSPCRRTPGCSIPPSPPPWSVRRLARAGPRAQGEALAVPAAPSPRAAQVRGARQASIWTAMGDGRARLVTRYNSLALPPTLPALCAACAARTSRPEQGNENAAIAGGKNLLMCLTPARRPARVGPLGSRHNWRRGYRHVRHLAPPSVDHLAGSRSPGPW